MKRPIAIWISAATLIGAIMRLWNVWGQPSSTEDLLAGPTALGYLGTGAPGPVMPFHPHLRDVVLGWLVELFGNGLIVRVPSLVFGIACIPLLGWLVHRLTRSDLAAGVSAGLLAIDPVHVYFSRQPIQEVWTTFFALAGVLTVVIALQARSTASWRWQMPLAGALFGLGVAAKFYVVPIELAAIGLVAWSTIRQRRGPEAVFSVASIAGVSVLVYLLTFVPWMLAGNSASEWIAYQIRLVEAAATHTRPAMNHLRFNRPLLWFVEPLMGWADVLYTSRPSVAFTVSDPITWLAVLPAAGYSLWRNRSRRADIVLLVLFAASYLPFAIGTRPVWILSSVATLPFAFALVGLACADLAEAGHRRLVIGFLGAALVFSVAIMPAVDGSAPGYLKPLERHMGSYMQEWQSSPHGTAQ